MLINRTMPLNDYSSGQATGIKEQSMLSFFHFECVIPVKRIRGETENMTNRRQLQRMR